MSANDLALKAHKLTDEQIEARLAALESMIYWGHSISGHGPKSVGGRDSVGV